MPTRSPPRKRGAGAARHLACVLLISVQAHERPAAAIANARVVANEQPWSLAFEEDGRRRLSSSELEKLTASDGAAAHNFGRSVAIEGNTVVIGAPGAGTGGAAYVLRTTDGGATYDEVAKLTASDAAADDSFGISVAIDGDTVAVGAHEWGNDGPGSAYVFSLPLDEISTPQSTTALGSDSATRAGGTLATALLAFAATALAL